MKKMTFCVGMTLALVLNFTGAGAGWALAEGNTVATEVETLETTLARGAANGFLAAISRTDLADTVAFYLLDSLESDGLLTALTGVTGHTQIDSGWVDDDSYQVTARLQPSGQEIVVATSKYEGRWQVDGVQLPTETAAQLPGTAATAEGGSATVTETESDTGTIVFQTQSGGDIYLMNADGSGLRRLTTGMDPQLSPDGTRVAFTRWEPELGLYTVDVDGSNERMWVSGYRQMKSPTWSADGNSLVFSWQDGGRLQEEEHKIDLAKAAMEGRKVSIPKNARKIEMKDGFLIYTIPADAWWSLSQVDLNSEEVQDVLGERHSSAPSGHPTDAGLLIYRGDQGLALHDLTEETDRVITSDGRDHTPAISPDGGRIAVSYWQDGHWEIHTMNIDGSGRQRLTSTPLTVLADSRELASEPVAGRERVVAGENPSWNNLSPAWSPDGACVAFVTDRTGEWEIWLMNADGTDQRPLVTAETLGGDGLVYAGGDERNLSWR